MINNKINMNKSLMALVVIIPIMTLLSFYIYMEYIKTKDEIFKVIQEHLMNEKMHLFKNYAHYITLKYGKELRTKVMTDKSLAKNLEDELRLLQGNEIQYLYILYKAEDGKFRYILDATEDEEERADVNQKFDVHSDIWEKAYSSKKVAITQQQGLQTLWITMAYPLVVEDEVIGVLGADFTYDVYSAIVTTLSPLEKIFLYINIFMAIMLLLAYLLVYLYYKTRKKAFIDPLTKVYNRQYLTDFLERNSLQDYALFIIDLDNFKHINDNFGHDIGDEVLISVVNTIKLNIRENDILIRFGGEEFLILVYKEDTYDIVSIANRIREKVMRETIFAQDSKINMTISIGINPVPYKAKNIEEAIKIADEQLYIAKSSGRNIVKIFSDVVATKSRTTKRISDIQDAIDSQRVQCALQPIYWAESNQVVKYEMLMRLVDLNGSLIMPMEFIPYIKHTQVYINLTRIVLERAIDLLQRNDYALSINLDLQDILNEDILLLLQEKFLDKKELASRLTIEILEHEEVNDFELINSKLLFLKEIGFKLAIDDFGSGYANFRYLMSFDIDILKIDGSIIKNIDKDKTAYNIVKAIVAFAKEMNMDVVAEQIETKEELETVLEIGVKYLQGYYLGRPSFEYNK